MCDTCNDRQLPSEPLVNGSEPVIADKPVLPEESPVVESEPPLPEVVDEEAIKGHEVPVVENEVPDDTFDPAPEFRNGPATLEPDKPEEASPSPIPDIVPDIDDLLGSIPDLESEMNGHVTPDEKLSESLPHIQEPVMNGYLSNSIASKYCIWPSLCLFFVQHYEMAEVKQVPFPEIVTIVLICLYQSGIKILCYIVM